MRKGLDINSGLSIFTSYQKENQMSNSDKIMLDIYFSAGENVSAFEPLKTINGHTKLINSYDYNATMNGNNNPYFNPNTGDLIGCNEVTKNWAKEKGYHRVERVWSINKESFVYESIGGMSYKGSIE